MVLNTMTWGGIQSSGTGDGVTGNAYAPFFGLPRGLDPAHGADSERWIDHDQLPAAYADRLRSGFMETTVEGLVALDNDWPTTVALPLEFNDELTHKWNTTSYSQSLVHELGHEGIPLLLTSSRSANSAVSMRRGVAIQFEYDFMQTEMGLLHYANSLQQMRLSVQRTNYFDVITAIMAARDSAAAWMRRYGVPYSPAQVDQRMDMETHRFGTIQKGSRSIEKLHAELMQVASRANVKPDMYIFPTGLRDYLSLAHDERAQYMYTGPSGVKAWMDAPAEVGTLKGVRVYETPEFSPEEKTVDAPLLDRRVTIGEFQTWPDRFMGGSQKNRTTAERTIEVYDEGQDSNVRIPLEEPLMNAFRFDDDGFLDKTHYDLALNPNATDMFLYKSASDNSNRVAEYWGQMETMGLAKKTIQNMMLSMASKVSDDDRLKIDKLVDLYNRYKNVRFSVPVAGTVDLTEDFSGKSINDRQDACFIASDGGSLGGFGSWFGLECVAAHGAGDDRSIAREGIDAFLRLHSTMSDIVVGDMCLVLDPVRCPSNMVGWVQYPGACNLFQRIVAPGYVPLFVNFRRQDNSDVGKLPADQVSFAADVARMSKRLKEETNDHTASSSDLYERILTILQKKGDDLGAPYAPVVYVKLVSQLEDVHTIETALGKVSMMWFGADGAIFRAAESQWDILTLTNIAELFNLLRNPGHPTPVGPGPLVDLELLDAKRDAFKMMLRTGDHTDASFRPMPFVVHADRIATDILGYDWRYADYRFGFMSPMKAQHTVADFTFLKSLAKKLVVPSKSSQRYHVDQVDDHDSGSSTSHGHFLLSDRHQRTPISGENIPTGQTDVDDPLHFTNCPPFLSNFDDMVRVSNVCDRIARACFIYARITKQCLQAILNADIVIPVQGVAFRPFMLYEMNSIILMLGGPATGNTFWGHADYMTSQDAYAKTLFGNLTYYSRAIVRTPNNIFKADNVSYKRSLGGCGTKFFTFPEADALRGANWVKTEAQETNEYPSYFGIMCPLHETFPKAMDIRGWKSDGSRRLDPDYSSAYYYSMKLGFDEMREAGTPGMMHFEIERTTNSIVFHGFEAYPRADGTFRDVHQNTGHHGRSVGPGCAEARSGKCAAIPHQWYVDGGNGD